MEKRPLSITIVGWFLIIGGLLSIYSALTMGSNPIVVRMIEQSHISLAFQREMAVAGSAISLACGYGALKGLPWSRVLYVVWSIVALAVSFYTSPIKSLVILSVIFVALVAYFLFRPMANEWFAAKGLQLRRNVG